MCRNVRLDISNGCLESRTHYMWRGCGRFLCSRKNVGCIAKREFGICFTLILTPYSGSVAFHGHPCP